MFSNSASGRGLISISQLFAVVLPWRPPGALLPAALLYHSGAVEITEPRSSV